MTSGFALASLTTTVRSCVVLSWVSSGLAGPPGACTFSATALLGYPTAIQEQNSLPGFTNRVLGKLVRRVFVAFDDAAARFARRKVRFTGNPVRRSFLDRVSAAASEEGGAIVILGGSQGSRA